ncbi:MAG: DUF1963 domain-containing protein [candidate division SR1 bacterium]|nr:DUF1963 domain-containing protein [candidate division SR1 bacterium]
MHILLDPYTKKINKTNKDYLEISMISSNDTVVDLTSSYFGLNPYLNDIKDYPKDSSGDYLTLLAQINLATVQPYILKAMGLPASGLLQFFISEYSELFGMDYDNLNTPNGFRVNYIKNISTEKNSYVTNFSFVHKKKPSNPFFEVNKVNKMQFTPKQMPITTTDYLFDSTLPDLSSEKNSTNYDAYDQMVVKGGIRLGGYPYFIQQDPRLDEKYKDYVLLFQVDSMEGKWTWGSMGVATFMIHPDDLKALNFSHVVFYWDCG